MSGITDIGFRRIARRFGAALVISEMVASRAFVHRSAEAMIRAEGAGVDPHIVQLAGCEAYWLTEGARVAEAAGAAAVDINMGCPAKHVAGGLAGSGLMRDLDHATSLVEAVIAAVRIPVTLKMRLGWDEASINAPELARRAAATGVALVTVHGRTRQQFYKGRADWAAIRRVRETIDAPLVANGDIGSLDDARRCLALSGADAVMIGRAAVGRPWLVGQIARGLAGGLMPPAPAGDERSEAAIEHYETILSIYGRSIGLRHARKHLAAYADDAVASGSAYAAAARSRLVTSDNPHEVLRLLGGLHGELAEEAA